MAGSSKIIKNRIKSVKNTKKITKAMEMVSAAKMRRAVEKALGTRSYAELALELLVNISQDKQITHPLLTLRKTKKILAVVVSSNKGLCGSFNANIAKAINSFHAEHAKHDISYITIGKKAEHAIRKNNGKIVASFIEFPDNINIESLTGLRKIVIDDFIEKNYDRVVLIYTNFISSINYEVVTRNLLPVSQENIKSMIRDLGPGGINENEMRIKNMSLYLFEPDEESILNSVLPKLTEVQIYQAILESTASEHSARMLAMRNASDSATEMIDELTLSFNQARQAGITQEIAEIAAGAAALK